MFTLNEMTPLHSGNAKNNRQYFAVKEDPCKIGVIICCHGNQYSICKEIYDERKNVLKTFEDHCHDATENKNDQTARRKLISVSILCLLFMIAESIGGKLANSLAIATDAAHLLTDFAGFMVSLFAIWVSSRPATTKMSFGWHRAGKIIYINYLLLTTEVIGALVSVLFIWIITAILVYLAILRIIYKNFKIEAYIMLITSAIGIIVNIIMAIVLHQNSNHNQHFGENYSLSQHSHQSRNINVQAALIHVIGDFLQSIGVFIASLIIYFKPQWIIVDPICTFVFSVLVLITTFTIMKDTIRVLMEGIPKGINFYDVQNTVIQIPGVVKIHNLRIWALSMDKTALSAHLAIDLNSNPQVVLREATQLLRLKYGFFEITLQVEGYSNNMNNCIQCQLPDK